MQCALLVLGRVGDLESLLALIGHFDVRYLLIELNGDRGRAAGTFGRCAIYRGFPHWRKRGIAQNLAAGNCGRERAHRHLHGVEAARSGKFLEVNFVILCEKGTREEHAREKSKNRRDSKKLSALPHRRLLSENYKQIDVNFNTIFAKDHTLVTHLRQSQLSSVRGRSYRYAQCCPGRSPSNPHVADDRLFMPRLRESCGWQS